jgi:hypothetical protein
VFNTDKIDLLFGGFHLVKNVTTQEPLDRNSLEFISKEKSIFSAILRSK